MKLISLDFWLGGKTSFSTNKIKNKSMISSSFGWYRKAGWKIYFRRSTPDATVYYKRD